MPLLTTLQPGTQMIQYLDSEQPIEQDISLVNMSLGSEQSQKFDPAAIIRDRARPSKKASRMPSLPQNNKCQASEVHKAVKGPKTFHHWQRLPEQLRVKILSYELKHERPIRPTESARAPVNHMWDVLIPDLPPKDLLVEVGNKQFSADVASAFYGNIVFNLDDAEKTRRFLKRIGKDNICRLRHVQAKVSSGDTPASAISIGGTALEKIWAQSLRLLSQNQNFETLDIRHMSYCPRLPPRVGPEHDVNPLHDFSNEKLKFYPLGPMWIPGRDANEVILALAQFRKVRNVSLFLGSMAGPHWERALVEVMCLHPGEISELAEHIAEMWKKRKEHDKSGAWPFDIVW